MKIRAKYIKGDPVKYISHLDLSRAINRAIRRAEIPIAFSKGFNPQPKIAYGSALPVGVSGKGEFADFELESPLLPNDFRKKLNEALPTGIKILEAKEIPLNVSSLMSVIDTAVYEGVLNLKAKDFDYSIIDRFLLREQIIVEKVKFKRGRKKVKHIDIRPKIFKLTAFGEKDLVKFKMVVATGQKGNVTPQMVLEGLKKYERIYSETKFQDVCRLGLFIKVEDRLVSPFDYLE